MNRPSSRSTPSPAGARVRASAARALARIVFDGASLRVVSGESANEIADSRDRALLSATLFAATRWWLRHDAALKILLGKALPDKARDVHALLCVGIAQIDVLGLPEYAVVGACVDAARTLGHARLAGLVNAVLRRWLRERHVLATGLDADPVTRHAQPRWMIDTLQRDWPDNAEAILVANNEPAPLTLRVNRRRSDAQSLLARFAEADIVAEPHATLADALLLKGGDVTHFPGFDEGLFSVQDGAAQQIADLLDLSSGQWVLDACAAPGGKAAHILERADVDLLAIDQDASRLARVHANLDRLGLKADVRAADASQPQKWWDGRAFDRILLDAPCSASGILRRQPDIRLHRRASDLPKLVATQTQLLGALWPLLAPGGRLVYATCSVFRAENEGALGSWLGTTDDASVCELPESYGHVAGPGRQRLPGEAGMDGFYYAVLERTR